MLKIKRGVVLFFVLMVSLLFQGTSQTGPLVADIPCINNLTSVDFDDVPDNSPFAGNEYAALNVIFSGHYNYDGSPYAMGIGVYGGPGTLMLDSYCNGRGYIQANFSRLVNFVAVDIAPFEGPSDAGYLLGLELYDSLNNLITQTAMPGRPGVTYHVEAQASSTNIAYAKFYGIYDYTGHESYINSVRFDNFVFGSRLATSINFDDRPNPSSLIGNEYAAMGVNLSNHGLDSDVIYEILVGGYWALPGTIMLGPGYCSGAAFIQADFSVPVSFVSIDVTVFEGTDSTTLGLQLYDSSNNLVAQQVLTGSQDVTYHLATQSNSANVAYARFYGYYSMGINGVYWDNLTFGTCGTKADVDIFPGKCPNILAIRSGPYLPVAILGSSDLDVSKIDLATVVITREGFSGVSPLPGKTLRDIYTPALGERCVCHSIGQDGQLDLVLMFAYPHVVSGLGLNLEGGMTIPLTIQGRLKPEAGGKLFRGQDCVVVVAR